MHPHGILDAVLYLRRIEVAAGGRERWFTPAGLMNVKGVYARRDIREVHVNEHAMRRSCEHRVTYGDALRVLQRRFGLLGLRRQARSQPSPIRFRRLSLA
jgi:hypothetical protein